jgi:phenylpropionate dioxygenase-like ring-hydroxylating dioxygenase large terminal subunit
MTVLAPNYPLNCWYVAAMSDEVGETPFARRLLDHPVVLYRQESGSVTALEDRCAHRAFPLSEGRVEGDLLVCAYHGFAYDAAGTCVRVPSQPNVPPGICVRRFPVREEPPFVWIWFGHPAGAALTSPPRLPWLLDDAWATFGLRREVAANYMLLHEHYLDLTYTLVVHPEVVPPGVERLPPLDDVEVSETSVSFRRSFPALPLAEWEAEATGLPREGSYERREYGTFVSPAVHVGRWQIRSGDDDVHELVRVQAFTPGTTVGSHLFLQVARNYALDRNVVTQHLETIFEEHAVTGARIVETVQATAGHQGWARGAHVSADAAAVHARRIVNSMLAREAGRAAVRPGFSGLLAR